MVKNNNKKNNGTNALRGLLAFLVALAVFLGVELIPQLTENLGPDNHPSYTKRLTSTRRVIRAGFR